MKAVRFHGVGTELAVEDVPTPEPEPDEVLVKVAACGVCASDLHMFDGSLPVRGSFPVTPGHEASGTIAALGPAVSGWSEGDRVTIFAGKRCGACNRCRSGEAVDRCALPITMGIDYDGAWAEYVAVPASCLVRVPDSIPLDQAAILADAVGTPFNAVCEIGALKVGEKVALYGIGGLGTHGVMLARMAGASFIAAVDANAGARERAKRLGADIAIDPAVGRPSAQIREATGGEGVDLAIDFVGANAVLKEAVASLAIDGRAVIVGVSGERIQLGPSVTFAVFRNQLRSVMGYSRTQLETLVSLVESGRLDVSGSVSVRLPIEDAAEGVRILSEKRNDPVRVVLISSDSSTA
ncbi:MAG TPA: zinc-binding dehydrogenase [Actinomycetota bacterium]|nr:zinc-binding dehydrogenase [Actinomycetota bacterium]